MIRNTITSKFSQALGHLAPLRLPLALRLALLLLFVVASPAWSAIEARPLTDSDCIKCHKQPVEQIITHGGKHNSELSCLECHSDHPPVGEALIPECSECHSDSDSDHFALENCSQCHLPHAPVINDFTTIGTVRTGCVSCHADIETAMNTVPSLHTEQDCSECHTQHGTDEGQFLTCLECHDGHSEEMTYQDCLSCHNPHQPTAYQWQGDPSANLCRACHSETVDMVINQGASHATELSCIECHQSHPPQTESVIPACAECHQADDSDHFKLDDCASCHNPHAPLDIDLSAVSPIKPVCVSCHAKPGKQLDQHPSAHTEMDCNECHQQHGEALECLECHSGHSDDMSYNDCLNCHQPHQPLQLQFGNSGVKQQLCGSCHRVQLTQLSNNTSLHAGLECIVCHKRTHKVILTCDNCHGEPHDSSIHQQFTNCSKCHKGPHNLRN